MNATTIVAMYAALMATAALGWQILTWRWSRRPRVRLEIVPEQDEAEEWHVEIRVVNVGTVDTQVRWLHLHFDNVPRYLDVTNYLPIAADNFTLPASASTVTRVPVARLHDVGGGIDSSVTAEMRLSNDHDFRSTPVVPAHQIDIVELLKAHGGLMEGDDVFERIAEYNWRARLDRLLSKYERMGWLRIESDTNGTVTAVDLLRGSTDDTLYNELRETILEAKEREDPDTPWRLSEEDISDDDTMPAQPDDSEDGHHRSFDDIIAEFERRGWVEAEWDSDDELLRFEIVQKGDEGSDLETVRRALGELDRTGGFVEFAHVGRVRLLYDKDGEVVGFELFDVFHDIEQLSTIAPATQGIDYELDPLRIEIIDFDIVADTNEQIIETLLRVVKSEEFGQEIVEGRARLIRNADKEEIGFVIYNSSPLRAHWIADQ